MTPLPSPGVLRWFASRPADSLFTTALNEAEILLGIELLPKGKRREGLRHDTLAMFRDDFAARVLPFDSAAADRYAHVAAMRQKAGRPISQIDAQIAAIALCRGASLATRNLTDFQDCGLELIDPWAD